MKRMTVQEMLSFKEERMEIRIMGWVRTRRTGRELTFIEVNDGSCLASLQVVVEASLPFYEEMSRITTGSSVCVTGDLVSSPAEGQAFELKARDVQVYQRAPESYPLQKKRHSDEFLRSIAHLRPRTNKYGAMFRIRSEMAFAVHHYYRKKGFSLLHTPILTGSDCEGAGELFSVTAGEKGEAFFGKPAHLTVSGQLSAEMFALALGRVYTFGPTFRAENSNTSRHAAEFWMVEPEMAFADLDDAMDLAEDSLKFLVSWVMEHCREDLSLFTRFVDKDLAGVLERIISEDFARITYTEAVDLLLKKGSGFEFPVVWGEDLKSEHERFLAENIFSKPVILYNYPKNIKPFYMRLNDDEKTVAAMDLLVPRIGELMGGSQREEREDILAMRMDAQNLSRESYHWYLESRRWGSVPHAGFGMGFERLLMLVTGVSNIRDVIPFPRTPGNIEF
ncbi:asparaginyl-tRNA synthetase [Desulfobotulus alkaliphilus]|uniref:Asparagine--tRNA ligase n=1 Tax=Desulfobotulus alkaliphilus TaxID=622671 RepID=A0A562S3U4_9BACT|nr:asparagine--tRNA ligase [Desulfobotulus alkaliphilus]TWI75554.1 asparaginyl-tRNA synthetase [Desulfobotulus alkaliphilus]